MTFLGVAQMKTESGLVNFPLIFEHIYIVIVLKCYSLPRAGLARRVVRRETQYAIDIVEACLLSNCYEVQVAGAW